MRNLRTCGLRRGLAGLSALCLLIAAAGASAATGKVVIFDLFPTPQVKPAKYFLTADAGPYLKDLRWSGWGSSRAVGTGTWILDCSNGGPNCGSTTNVTTYPATYVLTRLAPCPRFGRGAKSYRSGVITVDRPGSKKSFQFSSDYSFCAPRPTRAAASIAVATYVKRRFHAQSPRVTCKVTGATDLECTVRFSRNGKPKTLYFTVSGGRGDSIKGVTIIQIYAP